MSREQKEETYTGVGPLMSVSELGQGLLNIKRAKQMELMIAIVSQLDHNAVQGEWPNQECRYCNGRSDGYPDSQSFTHRTDCIVPLIQELREWSNGANV